MIGSSPQLNHAYRTKYAALGIGPNGSCSNYAKTGCAYSSKPMVDTVEINKEKTAKRKNLFIKIGASILAIGACAIAVKSVSKSCADTVSKLFKKKK